MSTREQYLVEAHRQGGAAEALVTIAADYVRCSSDREALDFAADLLGHAMHAARKASIRLYMAERAAVSSTTPGADTSDDEVTP